MTPEALSRLLEQILEHYGRTFVAKSFLEESTEDDDLMHVFGLTQALKAHNRQYWGRELGMCWQRVVTEVFRQTCQECSGPLRVGADELCDLVVGKQAIDTKYRIGSGDSGTLKKFKSYAARLQDLGLRPILLILRNDNLPAAMTACKSGGWLTLTAGRTYQYIFDATGFDLQAWLRARENQHVLQR